MAPQLFDHFFQSCHQKCQSHFICQTLLEIPVKSTFFIIPLPDRAHRHQNLIFAQDVDENLVQSCPFLTLGAKLSGAKLSGAKLSYNPPPFLPNETILSLYLDGNESVFSSNLEAVFRLELNAMNAFFTSREDCS